MSKQPILPVNEGIRQGKSKELSDSELIEMYRKMFLIREVEERIQNLYVKGLIHGTTHLCQGHEAISVGAAHALRPQDYVTMTYRSHGHSIARGMSVTGILAELMGRGIGVSKGQGGSMHLTDFDKGVIGSFGIVGAGLPVAVGAAMTSKLLKQDRVSVSFFGDGASNIGAFHEALNMASVWKAPVVFVCENNIYGEYSRIDETTAVEKISTRAVSYNIKGVTIDGNNVLAVYEEVKKAAEYARAGNGPTLIECITYRHRGHSRTDPAKYRPEEEVKAWLSYDPIPLYGEWLVAKKLITREKLDEIHDEVKDQVNEAAKQAENAPWPSTDNLEIDVLQ